MPRLMIELNEEEFDRLSDRALFELRHPRQTARLLLRQALELPERNQQNDANRSPLKPAGERGRGEVDRAVA